MIQIEIPFCRVSNTKSNAIYALPPRATDRVKMFLWVPLNRMVREGNRVFLWLYADEWQDNKFKLNVSPETRDVAVPNTLQPIRAVVSNYGLTEPEV